MSACHTNEEHSAVADEIGVKHVTPKLLNNSTYAAQYATTFCTTFTKNGGKAIPRNKLDRSLADTDSFLISPGASNTSMLVQR